MAVFSFALTLAGLAALALLCARVQKLPPTVGDVPPRTLSVIIPARNEAANLPLLLADLAAQNVPPYEIICVDDDSHDDTAHLAAVHGATVVRVRQKPAGWTGKTYACHTGASAAKGSLLLFLDADVRLAPNALQRLCAAHKKAGCTISVQPYHTAPRLYEQLSLFFNLIAAFSLGAKLPFGAKTQGLFGPVMLISATTYHAGGGHSAVKTQVIEDMALGKALHSAKLRYQNYVGDAGVAFRMYAGGVRQLAEGWVKNFAGGAGGSSPVSLVLVVLWVAALCRIPLRLWGEVTAGRLPGVVLYGILYLAAVALVGWGASRVGRFWALAVAFYPVCMAAFILIFLVSVYKKLFRRPVRWKGRSIR